MPNYNFIDTHCHFDFPVFSDINQELLKAQLAGVSKIIIPATQQSGWEHLQSLSAKHISLYYSLGLHPYFLEQHNESSLEKLDAALAQSSKQCVAVGECGLDFMLDIPLLTEQNVQKQYLLFDGQLQLAIKYGLPLIIHARKSHDKILQRLRNNPQQKGGVIHAFSGSYQQALEYVKLGFYIGVGGVITYQRANKTRQAIAQLPLNSLVLETDAPDMPISGYQGQPNHPAYLLDIFDSLCVLRKEQKSEIAKQLWYNSCQLFQIEQ
ncbi:TatD family hydrolase [Vibrio algivorus]|uniref:Hydrolase n=1 Tax=Vibrio algivorus TaxID=1667024 RepID=A0ABQ6EP12_9VIBR|nr:TatD family hydrolase [Vibrio algivorus]GLT14878.1 hydrolase [Vibrio algivorus]